MPPVPAMLKGNATGAGLGVGGAHAVGPTHAPAIGTARFRHGTNPGIPRLCSTWNAKIRRKGQTLPQWQTRVSCGDGWTVGLLPSPARRVNTTLSCIRDKSTRECSTRECSTWNMAELRSAMGLRPIAIRQSHTHPGGIPGLQHGSHLRAGRGSFSSAI